MAIIPGQFEHSSKNNISCCLDSRNNRGHGAGIEPELDRVNVQAFLDKLGKVRINLEEPLVELIQILPGEGKRRTG